jgi:hypothetical protein
VAAFSIDWKSTRKWCVLGAIVMVIWLLVPFAKCSFDAFAATPLPQATPHAGEPPVDAPDPDEGFFSKLGRAVKVCYKRDPLVWQEDWQHYVLALCLGVIAIATVALYFERGKASRSGI